VLEIEAIGEGSNDKKGVVNPWISKEEEVVEVAMEIQAESLEITTNNLENIDIPVERAKESIPTIRVNTNKCKPRRKWLLQEQSNQKKKLRKMKQFTSRL
jgi:hypothetical protein